jgi:hypothetical protein
MRRAFGRELRPRLAHLAVERRALGRSERAQERDALAQAVHVDVAEASADDGERPALKHRRLRQRFHGADESGFRPGPSPSAAARTGRRAGKKSPPKRGWR